MVYRGRGRAHLPVPGAGDRHRRQPRDRPAPACKAEDDGSRSTSARRRACPTPRRRTSASPDAAPPQPSTNPLFTQAEQLHPELRIPGAARPSTRRSWRRSRPGPSPAASRTATPTSAPMAIAESPDGDDPRSAAAPTRGWIYRFASEGGDVRTPWAEDSYPIFNLAFEGRGRLWATTGGGPLLELDPRDRRHPRPVRRRHHDGDGHRPEHRPDLRRQGRGLVRRR